MKPTDKQIKEFWEWCGFTNVWGEYSDLGYEMWGLEPNKTYKDGRIQIVLDLNSLFEYADPLLDELGEHYVILQKKWNNYSIKEAVIAFVNIAKFPDEFTGEGNTYEDALFWALDKVRRSKCKELSH